MDSIYSLASDVLHAEVKDEIVLMDYTSGKYFGVKGAIRHVFDRLCDGASLDEMILDLTARVDVTPEQARADILAVLEKMQAAGVVVSRI